MLTSVDSVMIFSQKEKDMAVAVTTAAMCGLKRGKKAVWSLFSKSEVRRGQELPMSLRHSKDSPLLHNMKIRERREEITIELSLYIKVASELQHEVKYRAPKQGHKTQV